MDKEGEWLRGLSEDLKTWFEERKVDDKYAAIVMAQFLAFSLVNNFGQDGAKLMSRNFMKLLETGIDLYKKDQDEEKRTH